jgi:integrase/recombinase XerD
MKEPQNVLPTFTDKQVRDLVEWKPKGRLERLLHLILLFLFDTGARIGEVLKLRVNDINLDDLLVTLDGKGSRQRVVPISFELRMLCIATLWTSADSRNRCSLRHRRRRRSIAAMCCAT